MKRIYVVEDNQLILDGVVEYFQLHDYEVCAFERGEPVLEALSTAPPDAVILDVMLPDLSGFVVARRIREQSDVPILFLTARDSESSRVMGFELGADDYIVKPFSTKELFLRTEAVLRRAVPGGDVVRTRGVWRRGAQRLELDTTQRKASLNGDEVHLTNAEWEILSYLAFRPEQAVSRERILGECLGYLHGGSGRTVDTHIANIRMHLGDSGWISTVRGYGYRFTPEADGPAPS
ncbi:MAG: DNA-binding response regulator [Spirochaetaceae bacterium]|nr:MAG: DNA-binding response regulator [Spirochaetaceae bacterium]